jgi:hypothetical protein
MSVVCHILCHLDHSLFVVLSNTYEVSDYVALWHGHAELVVTCFKVWRIVYLKELSKTLFIVARFFADIWTEISGLENILANPYT